MSDVMREMRERAARRACIQKSDTRSFAPATASFSALCASLLRAAESLPNDCEARLAEAAREEAECKEAVRRAELVSKFDASAAKARRLTVPVDRALVPNAGAFDAVLRWRPDASAARPGIMLCGDTGAGKSRALWALVRVLMREEGIECTWYCMDEFAPDAVDAAREGREGRFIRELATVPVLVLDDLGKERLTAASESALFAVVRRRCDAGLPILVSTQFSREVLCARFRESETGEAVVRRLCEFCEAVVF